MLRPLPPSTAIFVSVALALTPGCVSSALHQRTLAELEKARRENLELQRDLAEQKVRLAELLEARAGGAAVPASSTPAAPPPEAARREASGGAEAPRPAGRTPASVAPMMASPDIEEELITDAEPGGAAQENGGERTLWVARRYGEQGRIPQSIEAYSRFIQDYPFSPLLPEAFVERARARLKTGDTQGALEDFRTVAEAFPASPLAPEARREAARLGGS